jgi:hypothetical protein
MYYKRPSVSGSSLLLRGYLVRDSRDLRIPIAVNLHAEPHAPVAGVDAGGDGRTRGWCTKAST